MECFRPVLRAVSPNRTQSQLIKPVNLTIIDHVNKQISVTQVTQSAGIALEGVGWFCVKKQHIRMLLVSDVTNVAQVRVDACELSLTGLFSLLERHVAASPYVCVSMTLCCVGNYLSACFVGRI